MSPAADAPLSTEQPSPETLVAAVAVATAARDPQALTEELLHVGKWIKQTGGVCVDDMYARWLTVMPVFQKLDVTIWEEQPLRVEDLAVLLAEIDYYRQIDLAIEARLELLTRVRKLLSPRCYLGLSRIDLRRAELLSNSGEEVDLHAALTLCDDALACAEQLDDVRGRASAMYSRGLVLLRLKRHAEAAAEAEKARAIYEREAIWASVADTCQFLAAVNVNWDRMANAVPLVREALTLHEQVRDSVGMANALLLRAATWKARGSTQKALDDCSQAVPRFERARMRTLQGRALLQRAGYLSDLARYDEAQSDLEEAVRYLHESPAPELLAHALLKLADVLRRRNALDAAATRLDEAEAVIALIARPAARLSQLLYVAWLARELAVPDRPRIRRCAAAALDLAREVGDAAREATARELLAYAG